MDVIKNAIKVAKVATGEKTQRHKGGKARAEKLTAEERKEIAKLAAEARWKKED